MLRHIISVSLAMTACASLIPTKANAIGLTLEPSGDNLRRNPNESIEFVLTLNPNPTGSIGNEVVLGEIAIFNDLEELSLPRILSAVASGTRLTTTTTIARFISTVLPGVKKDGSEDVFATVKYRERGTDFTARIGGAAYDVQPVPEPITMFGAAAALGYGAILKRKYSKNTES
jgi:hypothetical protein